MRWLWMVVCIGVLLALFIRPALHLLSTAWRDTNTPTPTVLEPGIMNDVSRLNETLISKTWSVPQDKAAAEAQLSEILHQARRDGLPVSIAGARHSMGGHTMYPRGVVIDMLPFNAMQLDEQHNILHVQAGARWNDILKYLNPFGRSVAIMQSNDSFTVGGSISVNCHGWQYGRPPIASSVLSFRLMKADGIIVRCSRNENAELFSLALGGYGLFGVILDVDLQVVPNERYQLEQFLVPADKALSTFDRAAQEQFSMAYARMSIAPDTLLDEVIITVFRVDPDPAVSIPPLVDPRMQSLRRSLFRGSVGSDFGKTLRWNAETKLQPHLRDRIFSRNQLLNEGVEIFENRSSDSTDILHEYFVPRQNVASFVRSLRQIVRKHNADLLNVTVRHVDTDRATFLRYADEPMFAFVMLFNQKISVRAESTMAAMTREIINAALTNEGTYYLPYRLHATPEQFRRAYPQSKAFFKLKHKYDPDVLFRNEFYRRYGEGLESTENFDVDQRLSR